MKDYKRAYRRYMKHVKFIGRLKKWIKPGMTKYINPLGNNPRFELKGRPEIIKSALKGECYTFLRTTARPCNCYDCSTYEKYKRPLKSIIKKDILSQIEDASS